MTGPADQPAQRVAAVVAALADELGCDPAAVAGAAAALSRSLGLRWRPDADPCDGSVDAAFLGAPGVSVTPVDGLPVYSCVACNCLFLPDLSDDEVFPDRHVPAKARSADPGDGTDPGMVVNSCAADCACHDAPYYLQHTQPPASEAA